jgi:ParB family chromosome partitioning protein
MARKRSGLGRGLEALIPGRDTDSSFDGVLHLSISDISPNPRQPRSRFDRSELVELAASIQEHGVIQPLLVTESEDGEYTLIAGERRLQAARLAGLETIPVIVREASPQQMLEIAIIENVQRADLNPVETAVAYKQLSDEFGLSHDEIARRVGKSRVAVSNTLRLLNVSMPVLQALVDKKITEGHARAILGLNFDSAQEQALKTILEKGYTVRQTEELVRKLNGKKAPRKPKPPQLPEIKAIEDQLRSHLGTRVNLTYKKGAGGVLSIHYFSEEELNSLVDALLGQ